jgi:hypothetical protein
MSQRDLRSSSSSSLGLLAWLGAALLSGCMGSCSKGENIAERRTDHYLARLRCEVVRNGGATAIIGSRRGAPTAAFSAQVVLVVETAGRSTLRVPLAGGYASDDDEIKLSTACRARDGAIEARTDANGTVIAASLAGSSESAVALIAPNGALFSAPRGARGDAATAVRTFATPTRVALDAVTSGAMRDVASSAMFEALDDRTLSQQRAALLETASRCEAPVWLVEKLLRQDAEQTADRLFDGAYTTGVCSQSRIALEASSRDLVTPRMRAWMARPRAAPWPVGVLRWAREHGIDEPTERADAGSSDAR